MRYVALLSMFLISGFAYLAAEPLDSVKSQTKSTLPKPVESPREPEAEAPAKKTRADFMRQDYRKLYKETYNAKDYAKRYREDYAENPVYTSSYDHSFRRRNRLYDEDSDYKREPEYLEPEPEREPEPATLPERQVPSMRPVPQSSDYIYVRPIIRLPAPYVIRSLQKRAMGLLDEEPAEEPVSAPSALPQAATREAELRSAAELLGDRARAPFASRNYFEAMRTYERLVQSAPTPENLMGYSLSLFAVGEYRKAAANSQSALAKSASQDAELPRPLEFYSRDDDFRHHLERLQRHVQRNPQDADASRLLEWLKP